MEPSFITTGLNGQESNGAYEQLSKHISKFCLNRFLINSQLVALSQAEKIVNRLSQGYTNTPKRLEHILARYYKLLKISKHFISKRFQKHHQL